MTSGDARTLLIILCKKDTHFLIFSYPRKAGDLFADEDCKGQEEIQIAFENKPRISGSHHSGLYSYSSFPFSFFQGRADSFAIPYPIMWTNEKEKSASYVSS